MATLTLSSSAHLILHRFILRRRTQPLSALAYQARQSFPHFKTSPFYNSFRPSTCSTLSSPSPVGSLSQQLSIDVGLPDNEYAESERGADATAGSAEGSRSLKIGVNEVPPPTLTVKEKKDLTSYAHSLGKKLKSQQVGKSGVTDTVVTALIETLEANELLKLKIHGTCPGELEDVVKQLEETTGSVAVGQIGRTVILYRPSLTKLKAEEKKRQAQRVYMKRRATKKQSTQNKILTSSLGQEQRRNGRGRRGSSRYLAPS